MDKYYGNVCELDIIFNFQKAYFILDELLLAGEIQESSKKNVLRCISQQDSLEDMEVSPDTGLFYLRCLFYLSATLMIGGSWGHWRHIAASPSWNPLFSSDRRTLYSLASAFGLIPAPGRGGCRHQDHVNGLDDHSLFPFVIFMEFCFTVAFTDQYHPPIQDTEEVARNLDRVGL